MSFSTCLARLAAVPLVAAIASAGHVLVVAPTGAPYAQIQQAVDAASDGDVVLVKSGTYASFVVRNVELSIVAEVNAMVNVDGAIRVGPNQATRTLLLHGLQVVGSESPSALTSHGLYAHDVAGLLLVQSCKLHGKDAANGSCTVGSGIVLETCAKVCLVNCQVEGGGGMDDSWGPPGKGARVRDSSIAMYGSSVRGGRGGNDLTPCGDASIPGGYAYGDGSPGGIGLENEGSFTFAADSSILGGAGGDGFPWGIGGICSRGGGGGPGLAWISGTPTELRGGTLEGGHFGFPGGAWGCGNQHGPNGPAFVGLAPHSVPLPVRSEMLLTPLRELALGILSVRGVAGDRVEAVEVDPPSFAFVPAFQGVRFVSPRRPTLTLQIGTVGASGFLIQGWTMPALDPGVECVRHVLQSQFVAINGSRFLGPPLAVVVIDSSF